MAQDPGQARLDDWSLMRRLLWARTGAFVGPKVSERLFEQHGVAAVRDRLGQSMTKSSPPSSSPSWRENVQDENCAPEVRGLRRTLRNWLLQIVAWHGSLVSKGATEAMNNLVKRIKMIGFGFRSFAHYRVRVLLCAGRPNWELLAAVRPPLKSEEPDIRDRVRWASSLKRLTEEAAQEYEGRFLIELIQNGYDAHERHRTDGQIDVFLPTMSGISSRGPGQVLERSLAASTAA